MVTKWILEMTDSNKSINQTAVTVAALRGKFIGAVWLY